VLPAGALVVPASGRSSQSPDTRRSEPDDRSPSNVGSGV